MAEPTEPVLDLAAALGAEPGFSTRSFTVYIPNKDRAGEPIAREAQP
jgi:hypothetical protein